MIAANSFDIVIVGGGLAGLSLGILLQQSGHKTVVIEKDKYPRHRVCGEYISLESKNFLERIRVPIPFEELPMIKKMLLSTAQGKVLKADLPLGGFGISRYRLDDNLACAYKDNGGQLLTSEKVGNILFENNHFISQTANCQFTSSLVVGAWGKRSNLDLTMERAFIQRRDRNQYVGVKYHIRYDIPKDEIALHLFEGGYAGLSKIENDLCCFCYLVKTNQLKTHGDIDSLQQLVLSKNPFLRKLFQDAEFLWQRPVSISQISFQQKKTVENHLLMCGDSAGLISPLSGNGMSMAFRSAHLLHPLIHDFLNHKLDRTELEKGYQKIWQEQFRTRLKMATLLQNRFDHINSVHILMKMMKLIPPFKKALIKTTHGKPF